MPRDFNFEPQHRVVCMEALQWDLVGHALPRVSIELMRDFVALSVGQRTTNGTSAGFQSRSRIVPLKR